jgi:tetratricopeptide (TPR) repeat protein
MAYKPIPPHPQARAWLDAGLAAHRSGELQRAVDSYRQALTFAPDHPDALNLLGTALLQSGAAEEALAFLERAAAIDRNNARLLANLGQARIALRLYEAAYDAFRKAARIEPGELHFQLGAARALALQGKLSDAENILQRQAKRNPRSAAVWLNLGHVMRDRQQRQEAIDCYEKAVALEPEMPDARNALGSALHSKLRFADAEAQYRECIRLAPDHPQAHFNLASVLMDLGRFEESEDVARKLARLAPGAPEPEQLVASALGFQTRLIEAHAYHARAAARDTQSAKAAESLAMSFAETGRTQEALRWFSRAEQLGADASTLEPLRAVTLLADGAVHDGWTGYRARFEAKLFRERNPAMTICQGAIAAPAGKHVCVIAEQGLGDEIFFLRHAQALADRGARLTYRAGAKIAPLLARLPFLASVIPADAQLPAADVYVLAGDLPHTINDFASTAIAQPLPAHAAIRELPRRLCVHYPPLPPSIALAPAAARTAALRERLGRLGPPPYVGITWRAGTPPEQQRATNWVLFKSVPLEAFGHVLSRVPGTLLALQRAPDESELTALARHAGRDIHDFTVLNDDLEEMLALLALIDEYVGVSNTNMHLRACVGRTARVLVPAPAEWRWIRSGSSPWFPGFSVYRQGLQGDWRAALAALEADLAGTPPAPGPLTS